MIYGKNKKDGTMRKLIYSSTAIILGATAVFVWSRTALVSPQASTASSISLNRALAASSESISPISPHDMMRGYRGRLLVEQ